MRLSYLRAESPTPYVDQVRALARRLTIPQAQMLRILYLWRGMFPYPRHLTGRETLVAQRLRRFGLIEGIRSLSVKGNHVMHELGWVRTDSDMLAIESKQAFL